MRVLGTLYTSFAPTGAPALAELGHPDVASGRCSGTALACATKNPFIASPRVGTQTPLRNLHRTRLLTRIFRRAVCGTSLQYSPPRFRVHSSQAEQPAVHSRPHNPHPTSHHREGRRERAWGEAGMFRRDIRVSEAERGRVPCRSKEHTASTRST